MANLSAQAEALAFGKTAEEPAAEGSDPAQTLFRVCEGNRPTSLILAERLTPHALGGPAMALMAAVSFTGSITAKRRMPFRTRSENASCMHSALATSKK